MTPLPGGCYCGAIRYTITLDDPDSQARTSICHCGNCKRFTGGNYGITTKIPRSAFELERGKECIKVHEADNGSGVVLHREFCGTCGGGLLEFGVSMGWLFYNVICWEVWGMGLRMRGWTEGMKILMSGEDECDD
ncbi:Mss4-like protein, partial [Xylaria curta]